jgi:pyrroline-5-carboxylate reductase
MRQCNEISHLNMNITLIGGGNMASAIIGGLLAARKATPSSLQVVDTDPQACGRIERAYPGVRCFAQSYGNIPDQAVIVLAVKPQHMKNAVQNLPVDPNSNLIISIAAGITLTMLARWRSGHSRMVRAMPNTPALVGAGVTALYALPGLDQQDRAQAERILGAVGQTVWVGGAGESEDIMNAVTAVSGSGPAYVFLFMEAIEQAALELHLPRDLARKLVIQTFLGAASLATQSSDSLAVLRERVTSKGGTTEAALKSMTADHVKEAVIRAVNAANDRGREMGTEQALD